MSGNSVSPQEPSWWLAEAMNAEPKTESTPLKSALDVDIAIVGGGYTGLWTAWELSERDRSLRIALLEADVCGSGASGKNGGFCHGYWTSLGGLRMLFGDEAAVRIARAGQTANKGIREFVERRGEDVWWRGDGILKASTSAAQDAKIDKQVETARQLGVGEMAIALTPSELRARCDSPVFRKGALFPDGATLQPARLARALRRAIIDNGVKVFEHTPMLKVRPGQPNVLATPGGKVRADEVVLATNAALAGHPATKRYITNFSSYMVITEPAPELLEAMNWKTGDGISDGRMFVHYFRRTADGRIAMGTPGPVGFAGRIRSRGVIGDRETVVRLEQAIRWFFPAFKTIGFAAAWGGPVDVASDNYPFFGTIPGSRIHYAAGYSGHGVNPTYIGGKCMAAFVLREKNEWTDLPFCNRLLPAFPPEPFRYVGGSAIRNAIVACEDAEETGHKPGPVTEFIASLPARLHLRIGTR